MVLFGFGRGQRTEAGDWAGTAENEVGRDCKEPLSEKASQTLHPVHGDLKKGASYWSAGFVRTGSLVETEETNGSLSMT